MKATAPGMRFALITGRAGDLRAAFARDVAAGLTSSPKRLQCRYFYDREGSRLFEAICDLPEYYLTRAEREILQARAAEAAGLFPVGVTIVEFGSGSASKTRLILEAFLARRGSQRYVPVDISGATLEESSRALLPDYPGLEVVAVASDSEEALWVLEELEGPILVLYLGSNIGNLDRAQAARFLGRLRERLSAGDRLLLGVDLRKERAVLEAAYDDPRGLTARFNRNLLERINRELGGCFDPASFLHRAVYEEEEGRIRMYLVSEREQRIRIEALSLEVPFAAGEPLHTEDSYKYSPAELDELGRASSLRVEHRWLDAAARFCVVLLTPAEA